MTQPSYKIIAKAFNGAGVRVIAIDSNFESAENLAFSYFQNNLVREVFVSLNGRIVQDSKGRDMHWRVLA